MSLLKSIKIGNIITPNNIFLAPMAGITDSSYRLIAREFGVGLTFTEMVSAFAVIYSNRQTEEICMIRNEERPVALQIFGSVVDVMVEATRIINDKYNPDIIDVNAGCPVPKVLKSGSGAKLLEDPDRIYMIISRIKKEIAKPITIKMRLGLKNDRINIIETSRAAEEAGASLVTLHPRVAQGRFNTPCMWEYIALVKENLKIPVCGNGDIKSYKDAVRMITQTNCDGVMVGRATIGNPWLISDIVKAFSLYPDDYHREDIPIEERINIAVKHLKMVCSYKGELKGIREMRKILPHYIKGMPNSAKLRDKIIRIEKLDELIKVLYSILEN